ncbi:60Kd inner membrane protein-domain-containing protein [Ephemerocybe angulata]|uniref:60Kd inner membrane protein-domain-containing protein n=1 Tax=Ephemerocybe angulata TaxID=980116 RepID=A0A8H6LS22_9AGAR|nr:60Kd inner membrane protein-domain-containing protein [Tulosesus angulatus]
MAFTSLGLRAGLAGLAFRSGPQRMCLAPRSFSTRPNTMSLLRTKAIAPLYLSRRTYASKVPVDEPATSAVSTSSIPTTTLPESESTALLEATSDPLSLTDTIVQSIPPMAYGDMTVLGLTSWSPIGLMTWSYELLQVSTGMPWFWTIVVGSAFWRFVCVPFALTTVRSSAKLRPIQGRIAQIQARVSEAQARRDTIAMQRAGLELKALYKEAGVNPITGMILPNFAQLPITIGMFFALKRMGDLPVPQWHDAGVGSWFWANDLTMMDPTYILPAIFAAMVNIQISVGSRDIDTSTNPGSGHLMNLFRTFSILGMWFMSSFPAGLFVGLITTSALTTAQSLLLRHPGFRRALNIPQLPEGGNAKLPSFMESIKFAREKIAEAQKNANANAK